MEQPVNLLKFVYLKHVDIYIYIYIYIFITVNHKILFVCPCATPKCLNVFQPLDRCMLLFCLD